MDEIVRAWADETWPLSVAVCWVATRGDDSKLDDFVALEAAARELLHALKSGRIDARGVKAKGGDGLPEIIPRDKFTIATPFAADTPLDLILNDTPVLELRALAEHRPDLNDGDRIACRGRAIWKRLEVYRADAQEQWPAPIKPGARRGRGAPKDKRERVKDAMRRDLMKGVDLANEKQEALASRYGCVRETAKKALDEVLSEK